MVTSAAQCVNSPATVAWVLVAALFSLFVVAMYLLIKAEQKQDRLVRMLPTCITPDCPASDFHYHSKQGLVRSKGDRR